MYTYTNNYCEVADPNNHIWHTGLDLLGGGMHFFFLSQNICIIYSVVLIIFSDLFSLILKKRKKCKTDFGCDITS